MVAACEFAACESVAIALRLDRARLRAKIEKRTQEQQSREKGKHKEIHENPLQTARHIPAALEIKENPRRNHQKICPTEEDVKDEGKR
jgi:hypothetical protein